MCDRTTERFSQNVVGYRTPALWLLPWVAVACVPLRALAVESALRYQRVEETLVNTGSFSNPFTQTELRLSVTAPSGRALGSAFTWYGFHDGNGAGGQTGNVWKFRLLLDHPGQWTVQAGFFVPGTTTPNGPSQQFVYDVSSEAVTGEHGHVRVDSANWRRLCHDDQTPWIPFAMHASGLLGRDQSVAHEYIDQHAALGVHALTVRFHSEAYGSDPERFHFLLANGTSGTTWPPGGADAFDYARYDLATWRHSEQIIEYAQAKGVKLSIWFGISGLNRQYDSYGPLDYPNDTTLGPNQVRFIRYFLSRWAPYTHWWHWTVDSEYEEGGAGALTRVRAYAAELQARNPWKVPITTHVLSDWSPETAPDFDIATLQRRVANTDVGATDCRTFIEDNDGYGLPIYNAEGIWSLSNVTRSRVASWTHLMAGGFGHIAHSNVAGDSLSSSWAVTWGHLNARHKEDAAEIGKLAAFFNRTAGIDISGCVPANDLVFLSGGNLALCLASPGASYYIWLDRGGSAAIDLAGAGGRFSVARYRCTDLGHPSVLPDAVGGTARPLGVTPTTGFGQDYLFVLCKKENVPPWGDFDADGDVDQADFGYLQTCLVGSGSLYTSGCGEADLDWDLDVDQADLERFLSCISGDGASPDC